ncbi:MAG: hypothetical protein A3B68_04530 [Candidatus Melainabacteria bacterium RIFCSPHIGHO2_02_FULL_34_12]|nr:MAG: hypothetical protein A3B68_04530 [Candidatus Melainabacteria bacterium RIFCSPHIGHO2_02_FULL_34_12]
MEKSNTQVSQFAGESNTNGISKELGINGNCAVCALVSGARSLGAMKGDESTAQDDISHVRELMKPGSNHFQGTKPADIIRGAKKLGLNANMYKGNADDLIKELDKGNVPIASVNAKEYGVFKKKKEKVGHGVAVTDYDPKTNSFTVNDSLLDKPITVTKENMNRAMSSSHFKNSIISLSKGDKNSIVKNEKGNPETEESVKKSHGFSKPSNDSSSVSDSRSKAPDKNYNNAPIDLGTKEGPSLMPTYDPKRAFPRMLETSSASAVNKSKDPTMILKNGARFSEENDLNHVSQYKNSANPNAESPNNANSVPASLVTASRNLGRMDNSKGSSTANSQIKSARGLMNPGSNDYAGNHPRHIMNGAKKMGLYTMPTKGNSKNMINLIKERMQHGDQIMAFVNSNAYSEGASDNAHSVVVKDFVTKSKQYDPLAKNEENLDAGTPKEYAVLHDPRFEKPIEVPVEKFQEAMDTVPINGFRNSFIRLNKDPLKLNGPLIVVGDTIVRDTNGVISPSLQKELGLKRPK